MPILRLITLAAAFTVAAALPAQALVFQQTQTKTFNLLAYRTATNVSVGLEFDKFDPGNGSLLDATMALTSRGDQWIDNTYTQRFTTDNGDFSATARQDTGFTVASNLVSPSDAFSTSKVHVGACAGSNATAPSCRVDSTDPFLLNHILTAVQLGNDSDLTASGETFFVTVELASFLGITTDNAEVYANYYHTRWIGDLTMTYLFECDVNCPAEGTVDDVTTSLFVPVPEPASLALFAAGLAGLGAVRRRKAA